MATVDDLHEQAQRAARNGDHMKAAAFWQAASEFARTPEGAAVLRELSREATSRAELQRQRSA